MVDLSPMSISPQLTLLVTAVSVLEHEGVRVVEARAARYALPLIQVFGEPPAHVITGPVEVERADGQLHCRAMSTAGVAVCWVRRS